MSNLNINTENAVVLNSSTVTMTSLEIVEFINTHRQEQGNTSVLRHDHFMAKVPQVIGESLAPKFLGTSFYTNGAGHQVARNIYNFPKREACLMAMSYSYELQAEIFDRMTALEQQLLLVNRPSYMIEDPVERAKKWIEETTAKQEVETKLIEAKGQIEAMQPTIDAYDLIAGKKGSMCFQDAYKFFEGMKLKEFKQWMYDKKWIYKDRFNREAISYHYLMNGYLVEKATKFQPQIRVTYNGIAAMARQLKVELNIEDFK